MKTNQDTEEPIKLVIAKNNSSKAKTLITSLSNSFDCIFAGPFILIQENNDILVKLELHTSVDGLRLSYIENLKKKDGHASKVLNFLVMKSKELDCPILGEIDSSFGRTKKQLKEFYKKFGANFKGNRFII